MKIIDTHAHYDDIQFDSDRYQLLDKMLSDDVKAIINIGCSLESSRFSIMLSEKYDNIFAAVGIHPEYASIVSENYLSELEKMADNKNVVAIGEVGLDYHYEGYDREKQLRVFRQQILLAEKLKLPVIIHSRDAVEDTMNIIRELKPKKAVMHCFSGSAETAKELIKMGIYISFTGVITFKNAKKAIQVCKEIPADMIMVETDCPYIAPVPHRGKRNFSSYLKFTADKIAEIKELDRDNMIKILNENAMRFFNISL